MTIVNLQMRFSFSKWLKNLKQNSGLEVYSVWAKCIFDIPTATQTLALDLSGPSICMMYLQTSKHTPTPQPFSGKDLFSLDCKNTQVISHRCCKYRIHQRCHIKHSEQQFQGRVSNNKLFKREENASSQLPELQDPSPAERFSSWSLAS